MRKLTKQQQAFGSGRTIDPKVVPSRFEVLAKGIPESEWIQNEALCAFAKENKDRYYVPETFLHRLRQETMYDKEPSAYSLVDGVILPEPKQEEDDEHVAA
jgi:hypothetical protein